MKSKNSKKNNILRYVGFGALILLDLFMFFYIGKFYYDKQEMDRWHRLRENAMIQFDKGGLDSQWQNAQRELDNKRGEIILQFSGPELLAYISEHAYNQKLMGIKIEQVSTGTNNAASLFFKMSANGSFAGIWKFLQALETGKIPLKIKNVQLSERKSGLFFSASIFAKSRDSKQFSRLPQKTETKPFGQEFNNKDN